MILIERLGGGERDPYSGPHSHDLSNVATNRAVYDELQRVQLPRPGGRVGVKVGDADAREHRGMDGTGGLGAPTKPGQYNLYNVASTHSALVTEPERNRQRDTRNTRGVR